MLQKIVLGTMYLENNIVLKWKKDKDIKYDGFFAFMEHEVNHDTTRHDTTHTQTPQTTTHNSQLKLATHNPNQTPCNQQYILSLEVD